jgi:cytoskeletal protein CcmA (bactofilin family)
MKEKEWANQRGFILPLALMMMLFVGVVVITSSERTGLETRKSQSKVPIATLQAAFDAGSIHIRREAESYDLTGAAERCQELYNYLNNLEEQQWGETESGSSVRWKVKKQELKECDGNLLKVTLESWKESGNEVIARLDSSMTIEFTEDASPPGGIKESLANIMEDNAATSSGTLTVKGGGKVTGDAKTNQVEVKGGGSIEGSNLSYIGANIPNWYQWQGDDFWYNSIEKEEMPSPIQADPAGLKAAVETAYYTDLSGNEILLKELPQVTISESLSDLHSKKEIGQYPFQKARLSPSQLEVYNADWQAEEWQNVDLKFYDPVSFMGESINIGVVEDFNIKSGGSTPSLRVFGGDVYLYVDGDVELSGGASMQIEDDSSLTLIVNGEFKLTGGFEFTEESAANDKGEPRFSVLSVSDSKKAVKITGGTKLYGLVYSISELDLGGSGTIVGQAFGNNITVTGGTGIEFVSLLGGNGSGGGGSEVKPKVDVEYNY